MKKYYIGLVVISLVVLGLAGYVLNLGMQGKQDKQTQERARKIAQELNSYISQKQQIPASLSEADIKDVPGTIKYERLDESRFKFCITYKTGTSYGPSNIPDVITGMNFRGYGDDRIGIDSLADYETTTLYVSTIYRKGENCQTVKPYIYSYNSSNDRFGSTDSGSYSQEAQELYDIYCVDTQRDTYKSYCAYLEENYGVGGPVGTEEL